jgi:LmbE family N-acetylglucosaminyl deacetylase
MTYAQAMQRLPLMTPETLLAERGLIVIAPHPDDEALGCGGLLAWAARHDLLRHVVFLTNGERSHPETKHDLASIRRAEAVLAAAHLGLTPAHLSFMGLPDSGLLTLGGETRLWATHWLRSIAAERSPCLIVVTADTDPHCDHRAACALVQEATRGLPGVEIMTYPIWSWLLVDEPEAVSGMRIDIKKHRSNKASAIEAYASQHGRLALDVGGFKIPEELLRHVNSDTEVFLRPQL